MFPQLYTAASGMVAGEQTLDLVTGNLANVRTPGYRADRPLFSSYMSAATEANVAGGRPAAPRGVMLTSSWRPEEQGPLRESGNPLDLALAGPGWFRLGTPNGERLTRAGTFSRSNDGRLVTAQGLDVLDTNGQPLRLPDGTVTVTNDGTVSIDGAPVGQLGLAQSESAALTREGETLWKTQAPIVPLDMKNTQVHQGFVEESAVNATSELVSMIQAQRMYEMQQKLVDVTANTLARKAIELGDPR
jgi:flagellar basal-body rod protein FlgF